MGLVNTANFTNIIDKQVLTWILRGRAEFSCFVDEAKLERLQKDMIETLMSYRLHAEVRDFGDLSYTIPEIWKQKF